MEVKVIMKNGTEHIVPKANLSNVQRVSGHEIVKVVSLEGQSISSSTPKINRKSLEDIAKRELGMTTKKMALLSDEELFSAIKKGN